MIASGKSVRNNPLRRIPFSEVRFIVLVGLSQSLLELDTIFTNNVPAPSAKIVRFKKKRI